MKELKKQTLLSNAEKEANDKQWYKDKALEVENYHKFAIYDNNNSVSNYRKNKVNYDLINNQINLKEFDYVCRPLGNGVGEMPAKMINRDIISSKVKSMLGMEMKRPFSWNSIATNSEATTRKEQEEYKMLYQYVEAETLGPLKIEIEKRKAEENKGKKLTEEESQKIQQEIQEELKTRTPDEIKRYMERDYQDPSEILSNQLLYYLIQKCDLKNKFVDTLKHGLASATSVMYVGILNNEPKAWVINSLRFNGDNSPDLQFIEDGEYASMEHRMYPSQILKYFSKDLSKEQIQKIFEYSSENRPSFREEDLFYKNDYDDNLNNNNISVIHTQWKDVRKMGFLKYINQETGKEEELLVDEKYQLNKDAGDISIEYDYLPECYETWIIKTPEPIYIKMQPVPGQFKDINDLYNCKLSYYGVHYDNMNSQKTSFVDRLREYQYQYNIIGYRIDMLMASDKGKKVLMNIDMIPNSDGMDMKKWQYFMESSPYMFYNNAEEGSNYQDANTVAKVIDLSLVSDINKYIEIAEYIRIQCGRSVGMSDQVEGLIDNNQSLGVTRTALIQSSNILEPYFEIHSYMKKNVLKALIETAKIAYADSDGKKISYFLDDMSKKILTLDIGLLNDSTIGIFVSNSSKIQDAKEVIMQLTHAAMQNQKIELSDILSLIRQEGIVEAEETLKAAETKRIEFEQKQIQETNASKEKMQEIENEFKREEREHEKDIVILKEEEKRKTLITTSAIMGASFNPDQDKDNDGINDFLEIAKYGLDAKIKEKKIALDSNKFEHQKKVDDKRLEQIDKKLVIDKQKANSKSNS